MAQDRSTIHDVVIIGSGAGGGIVTKVLADLGVRVLLMEGGPMVTMSDFKTLDSPLDDWHRGAGDAATLYSTGQGAPLQNTSIVRPPNATDEPYTVAPGSQFRWSRSRQTVFVSATPAEQTALLDVIAFKENRTPDNAPGVDFFILARRMTVNGHLRRGFGGPASWSGRGSCSAPPSGATGCGTPRRPSSRTSCCRTRPCTSP